MKSFITIAAVAAITSGCASMVNNAVEKELTKLAGHYNDENVDALMESTDDDFVRVLPSGKKIEGPVAYRAYLEELFAANDNINIELVDFVTDGKKVAYEYVWTSDVVGEDQNHEVDLSGASVRNRGIVVVHLDGGKVTRVVDYWDGYTLAKQAGYEMSKPDAEAAPAEPAEAPAPVEGSDS